MIKRPTKKISLPSTGLAVLIITFIMTADIRAEDYILLGSDAVVSGYQAELQLLFTGDAVSILEIQTACWQKATQNDIVVYPLKGGECKGYNQITPALTRDPLENDFMTSNGSPASLHDLTSGKYSRIYYIEQREVGYPHPPPPPPPPPPQSCWWWDNDKDNDVDGRDLYNFSLRSILDTELAVFVSEYGNSGCP